MKATVDSPWRSGTRSLLVGWLVCHCREPATVAQTVAHADTRPRRVPRVRCGHRLGRGDGGGIGSGERMRREDFGRKEPKEGRVDGAWGQLTGHGGASRNLNGTGGAHQLGTAKPACTAGTRCLFRPGVPRVADSKLLSTKSSQNF